MAKEFSNAKYFFREGGELRCKGDPFEVNDAAMKELIEFLIHECGMSVDEIIQLFRVKLGLMDGSVVRRLAQSVLAPSSGDDNGPSM